MKSPCALVNGKSASIWTDLAWVAGVSGGKGKDGRRFWGERERWKRKRERADTLSLLPLPPPPSKISSPLDPYEGLILRLEMTKHMPKAHVMRDTWWKTGNQYSSTNKHGGQSARLSSLVSRKKRSFSELNKIVQRFWGVSSERKNLHCFFTKRWPFITKLQWKTCCRFYVWKAQVLKSHFNHTLNKSGFQLIVLKSVDNCFLKILVAINCVYYYRCW